MNIAFSCNGIHTSVRTLNCVAGVAGHEAEGVGTGALHNMHQVGIRGAAWHSRMRCSELNSIEHVPLLSYTLMDLTTRRRLSRLRGAEAFGLA